MQKTSRFSRLLTLVTAVALAVCLPVSAYAETETTEEAAAPAVVEEAAQDNTADEAASEDSASCVRVVDVTIFMDTTKGYFESDPDNVALNYLNRAEFEETPITLPTVIANEGWEFKGWDVWGKEHFVLGADATELGTSGLGAFPVGSLVGGIYLYPIFMEAPKPVEPTATPVNEIFNSGSGAFSSGIKLTFWLVYSGICLWTLLLFLGIIVKPAAIRNVIIKLFSIRFLRRWQPAVIALGDNMVATSVELRKKRFSFWLEVFGGTALSWTSRYMVVNAIFMAFLPATVNFADQWLILARQFVVWVVLMVSPTPGGSGLSEWLFTDYSDLIPSAGLALIMAICWRLISYYVYLAIGAAIVPGWLKDTFNSLHRNKVKKNPQSLSDK